MRGRCLLIAAALLFWVAPACNKAEEGEGNKTVQPSDNKDDGRVHPGDTPLLELFNGRIALYGNDATVLTDHIFICGHRSNCYAVAQKKIPENSIPAIEEAIAQGVDMVELDVRVTSDGVPVLMHDDAVKNTTNGKGNVSSMTFEAIRQLRMKYRGSSTTYKKDGQEIQVPTLVEALKACKDKIYVNLDVKSCPVVTLMKAIQEAGMMNQVMLYGQPTDDKRESIEWAFNNELVWIAIHPYISSPNDCKSWLTASWNGCCKLFQYSCATYYNKTTAGFGYKCHALGALSYSNSLDYDKEILAWYNDYYSKGLEGPCKVLDAFIESGSDFVQTDYFELAQLYFKSLGYR